MRKTKIPAELKPFEETEPRNLYRLVKKGDFKVGEALTGYGYIPGGPNAKKWNSHYGYSTAYTANDEKGAHFFGAEMIKKYDLQKQGYDILQLKTNGNPYVSIYKNKDNENFRRAITKYTHPENENRQYERQVVDSYLDNLGSNNKEVIIYAPKLQNKNAEPIIDRKATVVTKVTKFGYDGKEHSPDFTKNIGKAEQAMDKWKIAKSKILPLVAVKTKKGPPVAVKTKKGPPAKKVEVKT